MNVKPWQVEDLKDFSIEELFKRLKQLGLILDEKSFYLYAENCNSPEELLEYVWIDEEDLEGREKTYLLLFELWRRLIPDKLCPSVFCDQLDQLIELYDNGEPEGEEALQSALMILEDILDETADIEGNPKAVFREVSSYCAHDLERFLADYIYDQITAENQTYASELLDDFYEYVSCQRRFDFLKAHLMAMSDVEESNRIYERVLEDLQEEPDAELVLQIVESLIRHGDVRLFRQVAKQAIPLIRTEDEYQQLLAMTAEYYRCLDRDNEKKAIDDLLKSRADTPLNKSLDPTDQSLLQFSHFLKDAL